MMYQYLFIVFSVLVNLFFSVCCSDIFHVKSKITFRPDEEADYFGYSVSLSELGLHVGAPKARSRTVKGISPGLVFSCPILGFNRINATCEPFTNKDRYTRSFIHDDFYKNDMWFGAVVTTVYKDKLLICAPRDRVTQRNGNSYLQGVCYMHSRNREYGIYALKDGDRQYIRINGSRKEFIEYLHLTTSLYERDHKPQYKIVPNFATGQVGMSAVVTRNNSILIGAPGLLFWTGAVVEYKIRPGDISPRKNPITNPYNTLELAPDNFFGYSVDSGVFDGTGLVLFVAGAPRASNGYGQVLMYEPPSEEMAPLKIKAKLVGPHLGSYFGASLCTVDIDGDGVSDVLVGTPNYVKRDGVLRFDQGAVIVYMSRMEDLQFTLKESGYVMGSGESGARFGTAIASLGDIDGDGFSDVAIGAPYDNDGAGVVYIYKGSEKGLNKQSLQRIYAEGSKSFGFAISKGFDIDNNKYNDLAIGAYNSATVYVYRSIPTLQVLSSIKLPVAKSFKQNATHIKALFCVTAPERNFTDAEIEMKAVVSVDPEHNRAKSLGETEYIVNVKSNLVTCNEQIIEVNNQSDLSTPILLQFKLYPLENIDGLERFPTKMARISEDSNLQSSIQMQVLSECGDDLFCRPWLEITVESLGSIPYVPGSDSRLGVRITVVNRAEPAFSVKLLVMVPHALRRLPESCSLQPQAVACDLPAPLRRGAQAHWEFDLEYAWNGADKEINVTTAIDDPLYQRNITDGVKELVIPITPKTDVSFSGKSEPNTTIAITRETFDKKGEVLFTHYFKLTNLGPSDLHAVYTIVHLPEEVILAKTADDILIINNTVHFNDTVKKAGTITTYVLPLRFDINKFGDKLEETLILNLTSKAYLKSSHINSYTLRTVTTLILEPKPPIWPLIVGLVAGLLLLALIILALYKFGFFLRKKRPDMEKLIEDTQPQTDEEPSMPSNSCHEIDGNNEHHEQAE